MARAGIRDVVFGLAAATLLLGCVEGGSTGAGGTASVAAPAAKKKSGAQDVEAPEVFQATDSALWDGRPSLGGIWVAAPEVTNPERAVMFNPATGKSVTGALFKRERENPGPRLQLSSDAAEALGILAGQPTEIRVTALRKAEVEEAAPTEEATEAAADPEAEAKDPAKDGDAAAIASAAIAAVEAKPEDAAKAEAPAEGSADSAAAAAAGAAVAATAEGTAEAVTDAPKRKTWKERRAEAKAAREAKKKAAAEAKAAASAAEAEAAQAAGEAPPATPEVATPEAAAVAPIESAPLDARNPEAVAATPAPAPKRKTVGDAPAPAAETAAKPAPDAEPVVASGPARPIQVASFSKEDNATRAAAALAKIGITATPQKSDKGGKAVWGVIVRGDESMLKKIKDAGFADAFFLK